MTPPAAPAQVPTFTGYHWCDRCHRTVQTTIARQIARPAPGYWRDRWDEAARRDAEAVFQETHAATCGRTK